MKKKSSATLIGIFTLIGILIGGVSLVILGAGKRFEKTHKVLLHFEKSVYGLQVGSDVRFGGVRIGRVSSISVIVDTARNRKVIPVVVELREKDLRRISGIEKWTIDFTSPGAVDRAVKDGLRAGMKPESLVTGQLYVDFDMAPEVEGFIFRPEAESEYPVVPTIRGETEALISGVSDGLKKLNNLELEGLIQEMRNTLNGFNKQVEQLEVKQINDNLLEITEDVRGITGDLNFKESIKHLNATLLEMQKLSAKMNAGIDPILADFEQVAMSSSLSLKKIEMAAEQIEKLSDPRSPALLQLKNLVHETETTSRALHELTNDLKRNPSSLLRGKRTSP